MLDLISGEPQFEDDVPWEAVEKRWKQAFPILANHLNLSINDDGKLADQNGDTTSKAVNVAKGLMIETVSKMIHKFPPEHRNRLIKLIASV